MKIGKLFKRDIARPINGVVKADQLDPETIWQELEEFVVTKELGVHIRRFFTSYSDAISHTNDPDVAGRIGVWVSGFFGSGKSHFIKILHYLLKNQPVTAHGNTKRPFEFFEAKLTERYVQRTPLYRHALLSQHLGFDAGPLGGGAQA